MIERAVLRCVGATVHAAASQPQDARRTLVSRLSAYGISRPRKKT